MKKLKRIKEIYSEQQFLKADGFDSAILGVDDVSMRLIYSVKKCIKILVKGGMNENEALEYFYFNISGAYVGNKTPIWCYDNI